MSQASVVSLRPSNPVTALVVEMDALRAEMDKLKNHPVFGKVRDIDDLRTFMRWHVFAVWDFMSLVKRLQRDLTGSQLPWMPPANPKAARLINEIVLGEESDEAPNGGHASHFELYLEAMREVGIQNSEVMPFLHHICNQVSVTAAVKRVGMPEAVGEFVESTISLSLYGRTHEVLGSFFFGRENVIPNMFTTLLENWTVDPASAPTFVYYLKRHIELDGDAHGPAAEALIDELLQDDMARRMELLKAARTAVAARVKLWDALALELDKR